MGAASLAAPSAPKILIVGAPADPDQTDDAVVGVSITVDEHRRLLSDARERVRTGTDRPLLVTIDVATVVLAQPRDLRELLQEIADDGPAAGVHLNIGIKPGPHPVTGLHAIRLTGHGHQRSSTGNPPLHRDCSPTTSATVTSPTSTTAGSSGSPSPPRSRRLVQSADIRLRRGLVSVPYGVVSAGNATGNVDDRSIEQRTDQQREQVPNRGRSGRAASTVARPIHTGVTNVVASYS
ncbi:MAG: hypothetical protein WAX14_10885 [Rhodococcus sp. (in: high G+C Gram-positive bacteria)]|uniref:hypothetical protein n=1 Tax=Rhodococcus sp. TaxID=1831 RepID=UPI003BB48CA0